MALYVYGCKDPSCNVKFDKIRPMSDRNEPIDCPKCGGEAGRLFDPDAGRYITWLEPNSTRATCSGPTRKMKYTVRDVAEEKNWWGRLGIDPPRPDEGR